MAVPRTPSSTHTYLLHVPCDTYCNFIPQEAERIRSDFRAFDKFFRQCSGEAFYLDLDRLRVAFSTKPSIRQVLSCEPTICRGKDLSEKSKELLDLIATVERIGDIEGRVQSFFLPEGAAQLGCSWRGISLTGFQQMFLRYKQPWLILHVSNRRTLVVGGSFDLCDD